MVKIILVRHGFSQFNNEKRFTGQIDVPLDEVGFIQAKNTSEYILKNFKIDCIYSSDLSRAINTIKPVSDALNLSINQLQELRELHLGNWEGELMEILKERHGNRYRDYITYPEDEPLHGGERYVDLMERAKNVIEYIIAKNEGKTVLISSHGGFIRALLCILYEKKPCELKNVTPVPNASVSVINFNNGKYEFESVGYDDHLELKMNLM